MAIEIASDFAWVLGVCAAMLLQCRLQGIPISILRKKLFTAHFFETHFPGFNAIEFAKEGYPDNGSGLFAKQLSFQDWLKFNNYQRAHMNGVENIAQEVFFVLLTGLFCPQVAVLSGLVYILGREVFCRGYRAGGPNGRLPGSYIITFANLSLLIFNAYSIWIAGGGCKGLVSLIPPVIIESFAPHVKDV